MIRCDQVKVLGHAVQESSPENSGTSWDDATRSCLYGFVDLSQFRCNSTGKGENSCIMIFYFSECLRDY